MTRINILVILLIVLFIAAPVVVILYGPLLETKWFIFSLLSLGALVLITASRNSKKINLVILTLSLCMNLDINFNPLNREVFTSQFGFAITLTMVPLLFLYIRMFWEILVERQRIRVPKPALIPLLIFVVFGFASLGVSPDPIFTQFALFALVNSVLLYIYLSANVRTREDVIVICTTMGVAVAIQGLLSSLQFVSGSYLGLGIFGEAQREFVAVVGAGLAALSRAGGTMGYPNSLAMYLDLALPLVFAAAIALKDMQGRNWLFIATGLGYLGMISTLSRGGILASSAALALLFIVWGFRTRRLLLYTSVAIFLALALFLLFAVTDNPVKERFITEDYASAYSRIPMMQVATNMISREYLTGVGLNSYAVVAPEYDYTDMRIATVFPFPVHNTLLLLLAEIGLYGFMAFCLFLLIVLAEGLWISKAPFPRYGMIAFGAVAGLVAFILHGLVDYATISNQYTFWAMAGFVVGLWTLCGGAKGLSPRPHHEAENGRPHRRRRYASA